MSAAKRLFFYRADHLFYWQHPEKHDFLCIAVIIAHIFGLCEPLAL